MQILFLTLANAKVGVQHISLENNAQIYRCSPAHYLAQMFCAPSWPQMNPGCSDKSGAASDLSAISSYPSSWSSDGPEQGTEAEIPFSFHL